MIQKNSLVVKLLVLNLLLANYCIYGNDTLLGAENRILQETEDLKQDPNKSTGWNTLQWFLAYFVFQAILGIVVFENTYYKTRRYRDGNEERDAQFPQWRRYDAQNWSRIKFYPGAIFMPTRVLIFAIDILILAVTVKLLCLGHNFRKGPIPKGCRKTTIGFVYMIFSNFALFLTGTTSKTEHHDVDYSYYLGENYKDTYRPIKKTSTIVCNHISWLDCIVLILERKPAFAPTAGFRTVPLFNTLIECLDSIYIDRGGSQQQRENIIKTIVDRQELIEETGRYAPINIFAEGSTSNGTTMMKFKRGAFMGEKRITPMYLKYHYGQFSPAFDVMDFQSVALLTFCCWGIKARVNILPDFEPNEYLFRTHADKGKERWEVFAWALRDSMASHGGFGLSEHCNIKIKQAYEDYMMQKIQDEPKVGDMESKSLLAGKNDYKQQEMSRLNANKDLK